MGIQDGKIFGMSWMSITHSEKSSDVVQWHNMKVHKKIITDLRWVSLKVSAAAVVCMSTMNHLPQCEKVTQDKYGVILQQRRDFKCLKSLFYTKTSCEQLIGDLSLMRFEPSTKKDYCFHNVQKESLYKNWIWKKWKNNIILTISVQLCHPVQSQICIYSTLKGNSEIWCHFT